MNENVEQPQINRVTCKIPPFWKKNVTLWLIQVENAFQISHITKDETKYAYLVAAIDSEALSHVSDLILNPPHENKFRTLKDRLIAEFADSELTQTRKLLSELQLGDLKPSALLRQMRELALDKVNEDFLKSLWLDRLPSNVRAILSASTEGLSQLANLADKIHEVTASSENICAVASRNENPALIDLSSMQKQIADLASQIERLARSRSYSRDRFRDDRPRSKSRNNARFFRKHFMENDAEKNSDFCYYHRRFGKEANKCRTPCKFVDQKNL